MNNEEIKNTCGVKCPSEVIFKKIFSLNDFAFIITVFSIYSLVEDASPADYLIALILVLLTIFLYCVKLKSISVKSKSPEVKELERLKLSYDFFCHLVSGVILGGILGLISSGFSNEALVINVLIFFVGFIALHIEFERIQKKNKALKSENK